MAKLNPKNIQKAVSQVSENTNNLQAGVTLKTINLEEIQENKHNSLFRALTEKEMNELKDSIEEVGLLEPLVVVRDNESYRLISGHQRKKALEELGYKKVPVNVVHIGDENDEQLALIHANIKQRKLNDMELAKVINVEKKIIQEKIKNGTLKGQGRAIEQVAEALEISTDKAKRLDRLNSLIPEYQDLVQKNKLTVGKGQEIGLMPEKTQKELYKKYGKHTDALSLDNIKKIKSETRGNTTSPKKSLSKEKPDYKKGYNDGYNSGIKAVLCELKTFKELNPEITLKIASLIKEEEN